MVSALPGPTPEQEDFAFFSARMARAPEQCIRYRFDAEARPLWPSREKRAPRQIPPCPRCGAARQFEFQVLPQALHFMGVDSSQAEAPDWSTIAVYTCSASCAPRAGLAAAGVLREPAADATGDEAKGVAAAGTRVRFEQLQGRADLNGKCGRVLHWCPEGGRWAVQCDEPAESVKVKTANLVAIGEAAAARDEPGPLLGGYAEEYVWVQMDAPQPGGGTIESGFGLPPVSEGF